MVSVPRNFMLLPSIAKQSRNTTQCNLISSQQKTQPVNAQYVTNESTRFERISALRAQTTFYITDSIIIFCSLFSMVFLLGPEGRRIVSKEFVSSIFQNIRFRNSTHCFLSSKSNCYIKNTAVHAQQLYTNITRNVETHQTIMVTYPYHELV